MPLLVQRPITAIPDLLDRPLTWYPGDDLCFHRCGLCNVRIHQRLTIQCHARDNPEAAAKHSLNGALQVFPWSLNIFTGIDYRSQFLQNPLTLYTPGAQALKSDILPFFNADGAYTTHIVSGTSGSQAEGGGFDRLLEPEQLGPEVADFLSHQLQTLKELAASFGNCV